MNFTTFTNTGSKSAKGNTSDLLRTKANHFSKEKQYFYPVIRSYLFIEHIQHCIIHCHQKKKKKRTSVFKVVKYLICINKEFEQFFHLWKLGTSFTEVEKCFNCCRCIAPLVKQRFCLGFEWSNKQFGHRVDFPWKKKYPHPKFSDSKDCF